MEGVQTFEADHGCPCSGSPKDNDDLESTQNQPHPPEKLGQDCPLFGSWMITKKRQRIRPKSKTLNNPSRNLRLNQDPPVGSRFQILEDSNDPIDESGPPHNSPGPLKAIPKVPTPRFRNPLGGKNPQNGVKTNSSKPAPKQVVPGKEKSHVNAPPNNQKNLQSYEPLPTSRPKKFEHEDHELVFQMMCQIQSQMHKEGSLFLPGTKVFGPEELSAKGSYAQFLSSKLGLSECVISEVSGFSGGIWCFWNPVIWNISVIKVFSQVVHFSVNSGQGFNWLFSVCYGSPQYSSKRVLWEDLTSFHEGVHCLWLLMGDFNCILHPDEKIGGANDPISRDTNRFHEVINSRGLINGGFTGSPFTWKRSALHQRLDRVLFNLD
ncbi:Endonuclease/exonuclease/phosphatase superfamily [Sesbania bispinosa]|nr:Endonuclease/exonuclease/phosphatase superfamily [Sesbania bispinosa]